MKWREGHRIKMMNEWQQHHYIKIVVEGDYWLMQKRLMQSIKEREERPRTNKIKSIKLDEVPFNRK